MFSKRQKSGNVTAQALQGQALQLSGVVSCPEGLGTVRSDVWHHRLHRSQSLCPIVKAVSALLAVAEADSHTAGHLHAADVAMGHLHDVALGRVLGAIRSLSQSGFHHHARWVIPRTTATSALEAKAALDEPVAELSRQQNQLVTVMNGELRAWVDGPYNQHPCSARTVVPIDGAIRNARVVEHAKLPEEKHRFFLWCSRHGRLKSVVLRRTEGLRCLLPRDTLHAAKPLTCHVSILVFFGVVGIWPQLNLLDDAQDVRSRDGSEVVVIGIEDKGLLD
mmetsp:Transcript_172706/g.553549  ORF Transcript_172706/g.553549 Transcript_172706/m.553549 type:complete len:278 (-) Transcript_172706:1476-2309(-)